jgi:3-oxoacyl-[acyl-carrier-protein] synthase-3
VPATRATLESLNLDGPAAAKYAHTFHYGLVPRDRRVKFAAVGPIAVHLPERIETNDDLRAMFPKWDMDLIHAKTGIRARHIAAEGECASDLGVAAAEKLFAAQDIDRRSIDYLLFCTQSPDYPLPTTACLMQHRLGLPTSIGAIDFNLGCSGYVYGLGLADGLIRGGSARRVLLITAETYSKYIDAEDRSLRTIFGDGAAATLVEATDEPSLSGFSYGTDGSGADMLFVTQGGARSANQAIQARKRQRWNSPLYMDGPGLVCFTVDSLPKLIETVLENSGTQRDQVDLFLMHQATLLMLEKLRERLAIPADQMPLAMEHCGNTVSSTIPIVIDQLRRDGRLRPGMRSMMVGFGVGMSWAGCLWKESWVGE